MGVYLLVLVVSDGMWLRRLTSLTMSRQILGLLSSLMISFSRLSTLGLPL
jgi:hypothetical protein